MTGKTGEPMVVPCNCLKNFLLKQKMQLVIVSSRSLKIFSVWDLADIGQIGAGRNLKLITCSATGTCMLVTRALTSDDNEISSSGFNERCLFSG